MSVQDEFLTNKIQRMFSGSKWVKDLQKNQNQRNKTSDEMQDNFERQFINHFLKKHTNNKTDKLKLQMLNIYLNITILQKYFQSQF